MSRQPTGFTGKILTANHLLSGEVIYFGKDHTWVNRFELAKVITDPVAAIDLLAEAAGFERLTAEEWLTGAPPSEATWGVCLVLRKC